MTVGRAKGQPSALWILIRLARFEPWWFALHVACVTCLAYVFPFLPPLVVRSLLDRLAPHDADGWGPQALLGVFVAIGATRLAVTALLPLAFSSVRRIAGILLRRNMLDRVLHRPGARALPSSAGEALVRMQADPESLGHALDFLGDPIGQVFALVFAFVVLGRINLFLTLAVVAPVVVVLLAINTFTPRIRAARRHRQDALGQVSGLLGEIFGGVSAIKAANAEHLVSARLKELNEARRRTTLNDVLVEQMLQSLAANTAAIATGVFLLVAATSARAGRLSSGDIAVFASYISWLGTVVAYTGTVMLTLRQTEVSVSRMAEVLQGAPARDLVAHHPVHLRGPLPAVPDPRATDADHLTTLTASGLTFRYPESGHGVEDVDLELRRGELVAVTGRVGAGKTTLVRALLGLLPLDAGTLTWNGVEVEDPATFFVPPRCAYTSQVPRLFSGALRDNVLLGLERSDDELADAARSAVLDRDLGSLADSWDTRVGPRGVRLSGGQVQRAAAARMFVRRPELLVVDDLSSALDVETEDQLWTRLFDRPGATCLVVTHRRRVLERADRVIVLREGRVDAVGPVAEVLEASAEMRSLWS